MFIDRFIRIGHGNFVNAYFSKDKIYAFFNTGSAVVKKEIKLGNIQVNVVGLNNSAMPVSEIFPLNDNLIIARYDKSVKIL